MPEVPYTRVRIPYTMEEDLEGAALVIDRPMEVPNRQDREPPTDQILTYVGRYNSPMRLMCVFGHSHQKGYVFKDEEDRHYLVGHECGGSKLGMEDWDLFVQGIKDLEERAREQATLRRLKDEMVGHRDWIAGLAEHPAMVALAGLRGSLVSRRELRLLSEALSVAFAKHGGQLNHTVQVRDLPAEERERERMVEEARRNGDTHPRIARPTILKKELQPLGVLQGRFVVVPGKDPRAAIENLPQRVDWFLDVDVLTLVGDRLPGVIRNVRENLGKLKRIREQWREADAFFDLSNLELLRRWVAAQPSMDTSVVVGRGSVTIEGPDGKVTLTAPQPFSPDDEAHFEQLEALVGG